MRILITDEQVTNSDYDKVVELPGKAVETCYHDCRGVSFCIHDDLLYVEKQEIKIHGVSVMYSVAYIIKPKKLGHFNNTWELCANKVNTSDEIVIYGEINHNHPQLYCLKSEAPPNDECLMGCETQKPMTGQLLQRVGNGRY